MRNILLVCAVLVFAVSAHTQPRSVDGGVLFTCVERSAKSVTLVGDFNAWAKDTSPLGRDSAGTWSLVLKLVPGLYQYKFLFDGSRYELDPANPANVENYNGSGKNSVFVLTEDYTVQLSTVPPKPRSNPADHYIHSSGRKPVYLNIIWHQHQPLYVNPETDQLTGPWVRTHGTKDYYDMAAMLRAYPAIHCTINLTSSLLRQLKDYYIDRLGPFVDAKRNRVDVNGLWKHWKGKTDPWVDLALKQTAEFDTTDQNFLYRNTWNAFAISEVMIQRFPEYSALKNKSTPGTLPPFDLYTEQEMREIKFWFYLAYFDPDFLLGPVVLPDRTVCDLSEYVRKSPDGKFRLKRQIAEDDCNRIVAEAYKVMANVIPIHRELRFDPASAKGQIEIITTPYYHPILPLIYDSDLARTCQPTDSLPPRFSYPQDAAAQVSKAVSLYKSIFGSSPAGMWPAEGSVAQPILGILRDNGILWTASDVKVLTRSEPRNQPNTTPYRFPAGNDRWMSLVFRDTDLSDRIGFKYQTYRGEEAAEDFVSSILGHQPGGDAPDALITVILDGENAWEWYRQDMDGKEFLNAFYRKLSRLDNERQVITTTTAEYINGNPARGIPAHPTESQPPMKWLWPGSWINANYDTWIGEREENTAWAYLLRARQDLEASGLRQPDPAGTPPAAGSLAWYAFMAWEEIYAAEGSDWFWWFGDDQTAPGGDIPYEIAFLTHLKNMYRFARRAGAGMDVPTFDPIILDEKNTAAGQGTMARSKAETHTVIFTCDASALHVASAIFITGNLPQLADWTPNVVTMHDDGTCGDLKAGDGIWSLQVEVPAGTEVHYKYTNSGERGVWIPGEEFPVRNRTLLVQQKSDSPLIIKDIFGR
jgi:alpha-amylase/alpha-mannosidase (GH57 family)